MVKIAALFNKLKYVWQIVSEKSVTEKTTYYNHSRELIIANLGGSLLLISSDFGRILSIFSDFMSMEQDFQLNALLWIGHGVLIREQWL